MGGETPVIRNDLCKVKSRQNQRAAPKKTLLQKREEEIFVMPPVPSLDCVRHDPWAQHPLLLYNGIREKKKQDSEMVIRKGKKVKKTVADVVYKEDEKGDADKEKNEVAELEAFLTQDDFAEYRRDSVKSTTIAPIQKSWLRRMSAKVPAHMKKKHPELFKQLLKEIEDRYDLVLHETVLNFLLVPPPGYVNPYALEEKWPIFSTGPPPWWENYRINRHIILQQLRLLYPVVAKGFLKMRDAMCSYKLFYPEKIKEMYSANYMRPLELRDVIIEQIRTNGDLFLQKFVPQLERMFQNPVGLKMLSKKKQKQILGCASHMIVCNGTKWVMDTVTDIMESYENYEKCLPRIIVDTTVDEGKIVYAPPMEGWMYCLKRIIDEIINIVQGIPEVTDSSISGGENEISSRTFCKVSLPQFFLEQMMERFHNVMEHWLEDALVVCNRIYEQFLPLLDGSKRAALQAQVATREGRTFHDGFKEAAILHEYTRKTYDIPKNEFTGWLQVNNEDVMTRLHDICKNHQNIISDFTTKWLRAHSYKIIMGYKEIRDKLLKKPTTTAELMDLIQYIDEARGILLPKLKEDVVEGSRMCLAFMDYYLLGIDDMELTVTAHKLLRKIQPAFEKSSIMIEDQKLLFEDQLHQKTQEVKADLKKLLRRVRDDFGRYGEYDLVPQYCEDLKYVTKRVAILQEAINWINSEELLFKLNPSEFADMTEIRSHIEPFTQLFTTVLQWQKAEKKYMDGDFQLDPVAIDNETSNYHTELDQLQQLLKGRIKAAKEKEAKERQIPISLIYDEDNLDEIPPPLKLCNVTLESISQFRTHLDILKIICNPTLRPSHWEQMSAVTMKDLTPNSGSSLRKYLKMDLRPFLYGLQQISDQATKDDEAMKFGDEEESSEEEEEEEEDESSEEEEIEQTDEDEASDHTIQ